MSANHFQQGCAEHGSFIGKDHDWKAQSPHACTIILTTA